MDSHLAFRIKRSSVRQRIVIPKFYDPDIALAFRIAEAESELPELGELLLPGEAGSRLGRWIPRELYESGGDIPFVRTSDMSHWRIRADYKKGVSQAVYESISDGQDVRANDLLMVAHGTYLVGNVAIVTESDRPLVLQDHVFRLRVDPRAGIDPRLLLPSLSSSFVRRQVRSRQFSAEIIDKLGDRHLGIKVPIPRDHGTRQAIADRVGAVLAEQDEIRKEIQAVSQSTLRMSRERSEARFGFSVRRLQIRRRILLPKYYDPVLEDDLARAKAAEPGWISLGDLVGRGLLQVDTGVEVGKMAYGTGDIPFVRTSDLVDWELKRDTKQAVSQEIYDAYAPAGTLLPHDVLVVRDGTYLVGTSAMVTPSDCPAMFCGGLCRLRSTDHDGLSPYSLLASLNHPLVRRQMRAKQFTRDVIDTLGRRLLEVEIPWRAGTTDEAERARRVIERKAAAKKEISAIVELLEPPVPVAAAGRPGWSMR